MKNIVLGLLFITALSFFQSSCKKKNQTVPYVPVDIYINVALPAYINLSAPGGWVYVSGGSKGLIVYRQTLTKFMVYDRHCTYNIDNPCGAATVDSSNVSISCACDGSVYQIYDGAVTNGPATFNLQQYSTSFDDLNNTLHIYN